MSMETEYEILKKNYEDILSKYLEKLAVEIEIREFLNETLTASYAEKIVHQEQLDKKEAEKMLLQEQLNKKEAEKMLLQEQLNKSQVPFFKSTIEKHCKENDVLEKQLERSEEAFYKSLSKIQTLEEELAESRFENKQFSRQIEILNSLNDDQTEKDFLEKQLEEKLIDHKKQLDKKLTDFKKQLDEKLIDHEKQLNEKEGENLSLKKQLDKISDLLDETLTANLAEKMLLQEQLEQSQAENKEIKKKYSDLVDQCV